MSPSNTFRTERRAKPRLKLHKLAVLEDDKPDSCCRNGGESGQKAEAFGPAGKWDKRSVKSEDGIDCRCGENEPTPEGLKF